MLPALLARVGDLQGLLSALTPVLDDADQDLICLTPPHPTQPPLNNVQLSRLSQYDWPVPCRIYQPPKMSSCAEDKLADDEHRPLLDTNHPKPRTRRTRAGRRGIPFHRFYEAGAWAFIVGFSFCLLLDLLFFHRSAWWPRTRSLESCAWSHLEPHVGLLDVPPISRDEFFQRQETLASALREAGVDAYIAEESASSAYYANISASSSLSERPFLMILDQDAQFSYLVPKFEAGRIAGLDMVFRDKKVIEWREEESPYEVLAKETGFSKVMLDEHTRFMIAAGLQNAGVKVVPMTETIQSLRSVKTDAEIVILKAINAFTLELVRSLQKCIKVGMTQETVVTAAHALYTHAGVGEGFWSIVLFGEQAAFPHGGKHNKKLEEGEFVLIDIGSKLHDYGSDVTRTILPSGAKVSDELMGIWETVHAAQSAGFNLMHPNETCSKVDSASRKPVSDAGYAEFYTHRLGHGLGLEMHEHPYLNGANAEKLKVGQVVTNEPVSRGSSHVMSSTRSVQLIFYREYMSRASRHTRLEKVLVLACDWRTQFLSQMLVAFL